MSTTPLRNALWMGADAGPMIDEPIGDVLARRAEADPGRTALLWSDGAGGVTTISYGEILDRARALARELVTFGAKQFLAVAAPNCTEWVIAEYAAALAGWVLVPLNQRMADPELAHILHLTHPALVLAVDDDRGAPVRSRLAEIVAADPDLDAPPVLEMLQWIRTTTGSRELPKVDADQPFLVQYTSGTTGKPKGALHTHRSALNAAALWCGDWQQNADDIFVTPVPMHHVGGTVTGLLAPLSVGGAVGLLKQYDPAVLADLLVASQATVLAAVPTMLFDLLQQPGFTSDQTALRIITGGGAPVTEQTVHAIEEAFGVTFVVSYGQSESPAILGTPPSANIVKRAVSLGRPLPRRDVCIRRLDDAAVADIDEVGEICTRSSLVMQGYLGQPDQTAETIDDDGWLHTGDLGSMDEHGYVTFRGRAREVIIRGGENLYPAEIDAVFLSHPGVAAVSVVGAPDDRLGEVPVGIVIRAAGHEVTADELAQFGRERLASFKVPRQWFVTEAFPMTASGKVRKVELQSLAADGVLSPLR